VTGEPREGRVLVITMNIANIGLTPAGAFDVGVAAGIETRAVHVLSIAANSSSDQLREKPTLSNESTSSEPTQHPSQKSMVLLSRLLFPSQDAAQSAGLNAEITSISREDFDDLLQDRVFEPNPERLVEISLEGLSSDDKQRIYSLLESSLRELLRACDRARVESTSDPRAIE